jgi:betaine-aldehyde dehydrogenase
VWINDFGPYVPAAEWGGFGHSGFGRELGRAGLAEYQETKHIWTNTRPAPTGWFPSPSRDTQQEVEHADRGAGPFNAGSGS